MSESVENVAENVAESVENVGEKKVKKFVADIESKALMDAISEMEDFSIEKLMKVLPKLMVHVENYKNLNGQEKRGMVINMVKHIIDNTDGPGDDEYWDPILKRLVPGIIDTLVEVDKGKLKLKKKSGLLKLIKKLNCCC